MSIICSNNNGWVVSHSMYINSVYKSVQATNGYRVKREMFEINTPYMKHEEALKKVALYENSAKLSPCQVEHKPHKRRKKNTDDITVVDVGSEYTTLKGEVDNIKELYPSLVSEAKLHNHFEYVSTMKDIRENNWKCRDFSTQVLQLSTLTGEGCSAFHGRNTSADAIAVLVQDEKYLIPNRCSFYCKDVSFLCRESIQDCPNKGFDLIVIDPPWWNKYIRRRRSANKTEGYSMLRTEDMMQMKIKSFLAPGGLIAVWCTNSQSHIQDIHEKLFPAWGVSYVATWYWLKVDRSGTPVCNFSVPPGKQPFERILFGRCAFEAEKEASQILDPANGKIVISIPSAVHSHKPPLIELLEPYVISTERHLEVFARTLLPNTVSWGLEVLKLQHECLFSEVTSQLK